MTCAFSCFVCFDGRSSKCLMVSVGASCAQAYSHGFILHSVMRQQVLYPNMAGTNDAVRCLLQPLLSARTVLFCSCVSLTQSVSCSLAFCPCGSLSISGCSCVLQILHRGKTADISCLAVESASQRLQLASADVKPCYSTPL